LFPCSLAKYGPKTTSRDFHNRGLDSRSALDPELADYFGTLAGTMLALFQAVTDGQEWREMLKPLMREISPWMAVPFCIYIAFTVFALLPLDLEISKKR